MQPAGGWYNYQFETDLCCARSCPPGAHPLYVGKSNEPLRRLLEHAKEQPWFPYVTGWKVFPEVYATEQDALSAESARIHTLLPLANRAQNEGNRHRLDFGRPVPRAARSRAPQLVVEPVPVRREWSPRRRKAVALLAVWLVLAVVCGVAAVRDFGASLSGGAQAGALGASAVYLFAWVNRKPRRRRPAGRSRRRRR